MKFITSTTILKPILAKLGMVISSRPTLPVLGTILVNMQKNKVMLTTSNLGITISCELKAETEGKGAFLAPFAELKKLIALEEGACSIEHISGEGVRLRCEADQFCLGQPGEIEDFPKLPEIEKDELLKMPEGFVNSISMAALSVGTDETKPALTNVLIELIDETINIVSCDAQSLYLFKFDKAFNKKITAELLIPASVAAILEGAQNIELGYNKNHILFMAEGITIYCTRSEAKYANYRAVIPAHNDNIKLAYPDIKIGLEKALVVAPSTAYYGIDCIISPMDFELNAQNPDTGMNAKCVITAEMNDIKNGSIRINGRLFNRALQQILYPLKKGDKICLGIQSPIKPITMRIEGNENLTILTMPVIVN